MYCMLEQDMMCKHWVPKLWLDFSKINHLMSQTFVAEMIKAPTNLTINTWLTCSMNYKKTFGIFKLLCMCYYSKFHLFHMWQSDWFSKIWPQFSWLVSCEIGTFNRSLACAILHNSKTWVMYCLSFNKSYNCNVWNNFSDILSGH